mmetsp:Transcript_19582/g.48211  ORF Transcript_19582/g.48211 Transcript_19582/m.48211 type:complete len:106 (+) Transcript_19582:58-375(+)
MLSLAFPWTSRRYVTHFQIDVTEMAVQKRNHRQNALLQYGTSFDMISHTNEELQWQIHVSLSLKFESEAGSALIHGKTTEKWAPQPTKSSISCQFLTKKKALLAS